MKYYRCTVHNTGIYEIIQNKIAKDDPRRLHKPDGSWLPKKGMDYPGAISAWTDFGFQKYIDSGLLDWHTSLIKEDMTVMIIEQPKEILYKDTYQIIFDTKFLKVTDKMTLENFLELR
jgi:hypothetical protein